MGYHKVNRRAAHLGGSMPMAGLVRASAHARRIGTETGFLHTTTIEGGGGPSMQSVVANNDLDEMLSLADLAGKDYTAERQNVTVVVNAGGSTEASDPGVLMAAQQLHRAAVRCPRRPQWTAEMSADELDAQERASFLTWRRALASVEEDTRLMVTPFEKNLEVWRQLWRVLEKSHVVVQVVDARDPLLYRCEDVERYVEELAASKRSVLLLNKADLLPDALRLEWAKYFTRKGIAFHFWSAKAAEAALKHKASASAAAVPVRRTSVADADDSDFEDDEAAAPHERPTGAAAEATGAAGAAGTLAVADTELRQYNCEVLGRDELLERLEATAEAAAAAAAAAVGDEEGGGRKDPHVVVGFVGYPNVGKSSTLNALIGEKKASVAATPGRTKHFQTINLSDSLTLCDCPGLVFPQFSSSKAEMALAGVLPLDRLTDVRMPIGLIARRFPRAYLEALYHIVVTAPMEHEDPDRPPTASELLRAYAASRGLTAQMGRPDEHRAGREMLKDYRDGKMLGCRMPPPPDAEGRDAATAPVVYWVPTLAPRARNMGSRAEAAATSRGVGTLHQLDEELLVGNRQSTTAPRRKGVATQGQDLLGLSAHVDESREASVPVDFIHRKASKGKETRAAHKFHMKMARTKADRGQDAAAGGDGGMLAMGKRGGIKPVSMQR